ncbi:Os05g0478150 [Oryza sativa Japonica Group]|uniref:Os05g0478150 protein n=1 Tax=Oryza sativa subsp. japonica TaxID=39947 RepID=A0A0P0WNM0_ORYSJ|nr:Os05g0478150 [Oryza sativa Japonica Group]
MIAPPSSLDPARGLSDLTLGNGGSSSGATQGWQQLDTSATSLLPSLTDTSLSPPPQTPTAAATAYRLFKTMKPSHSPALSPSRSSSLMWHEHGWGRSGHPIESQCRSRWQH